MPSIYIYKMTVDDGGAPCVRDGLLTLAICKPAIRRSAKPGSIILAFAANHVQGWRPRGSYRDHSLIYIAEIKDNLPAGNYYGDHRYERRPDCIYKWEGDSLRYREQAKFHGDDASLRRDVGTRTSGYQNAHVLLSRKYKYFADSGPTPHVRELPVLSRMIFLLNQGHRIRYSKGLSEEIRTFAAMAWSLKSPFKSTPVPEARCEQICDQGRDYTTVTC